MDERREDTQSGHWLPALRPDTAEYPEDDAVAGASSPITSSQLESDVAPSAAVAEQGETRREADEAVPAIEDASEQPSVMEIPASANAASSSHPQGVSFGSDEMSDDGDNERLDPAWGIKRQDTAQIFDAVRRTSTFPDIAPEEHDKLEHEVEEAVERVNGITEAQTAAEVDKHITEPNSMQWLDDDHDGSREAQAWTVPTQQETIDDADQRFEEGLSLIQAEHMGQDASDAAPQASFDMAQNEEGDSFFANINDPPLAAPEPPTLNRKSTAQVFNALHLPDQTLPDSPALPVPADPEASFFDQVATIHQETALEPEPPVSPPQDVDAAWAAALDDEDEAAFLVEDADDLLPDSEPSSPSSFMASLQTADPSLQANQPPPPRPIGQTQRQNSAHPYAPHQPSTADLFQIPLQAHTTHNTLGLARPDLGQAAPFQNQLQQRPQPHSVKSFVDQAKDGYKSPYDLPLEISKTKRRANVPQPVQTTRGVAPPPRSSSLSEQQIPSPYAANGPPTAGSHASQPPMPSPAMLPPRSTSTFGNNNSGATPKSASSSGFFEELPMTSKPRQSGRYTPHQSISAAAPPPLPPQSPPTALISPLERPLHSTQPDAPISQYGLRAPERLDPYANVPVPQPPPIPAATSTRYSPAPTSGLGLPRTGPSPRYSPAPPTHTGTANASRYAAQPTPPPAPSQPPSMPSRTTSQPPPIAAQILPFQPRTSSPLAHPHNVNGAHVNDVSTGTTQPQRPAVPPTQYPHSTSSVPQALPSPQRGGYGELVNQVSPPKRPDGQALPPPRRSQTQSPSKQRPQVPIIPSYSQHLINRPATAYGQPSPGMIPPQVHGSFPHQARSQIPDPDFLPPQDGTELDDLRRWQGAPIFKFGFGGSISSTFPRHVPRYTTGLTRPQIKPMSGEVSIRNVKDILPADDLLQAFPGPLRSKSKKKDLLSWLSNYITTMEAGMPNVFSAQSHDDPARRHQEKVLLWKLMRVMVENDGLLDGPALKQVNLLLNPEVHNVDESSPIQYRAGEQTSGIYGPGGANVRHDAVDALAMEGLRKRLLSGDRHGAVIHAMDNRLWSHALIIASTQERSLWGQVIREFVRQEVKTAGEGTESLSALYEIFGGNIEDSIDELVPPSARAGLKMISKSDTGAPAKNALDGMNRWKETLSLVLNNRSQGDHQALAVLGNLLQDYNRIEAAHICYLFSKSAQRPGILGGVDEDHAAIVLLGTNHKMQPADLGRDMDSIVLTEVYEFANNILASGASSSFLPHLSAFKLQKAVALAQSGQKAEAQAYCDAIAATLGKSSKMSPYYHPLFLTELDNLSNQLKQTPIQGVSWIKNPSLEKVGGSMWTKFSSFVAGDDSDAESKGSGKDPNEAGPFANVASTPSISRNGSQSDIYGSYPQAIPATMAGSRYAPNGIQSSRSSAELTRGRPSLDSQRSPPATSYSQIGRQSEPMSMFQQGQVASAANPYQAFAATSPPSNYPQSPPRSSYMPNAADSAAMNDSPQRPGYAPTPPSEDVLQQAYAYNSAAVPNAIQHVEQPISYGGYMPRVPTPVQNEDLIRPSYEEQSQSYGFEPPTAEYMPYVPEPDSPEDDSQAPKSKKKSFMDDDDDGFGRSSSKPAPAPADDGDRKKANDAATDAAFRAAAEADAAQANEKKESKRSSSWFGGWLGGKKNESLDAGSSKSAADQKVYRAKLGESKMKLYYDKDLKKWINPDNPDAGAKTATPPPPRMGGTPAPPMGGPPPRPPMGGGLPTSGPATPSFAMGPPSGPPSRVGTPADGPGPGVPSPQIGPAGTTPPIGPSAVSGVAAPPRPGTAMSNASSIDDLIGPATGRKTAKGARKGGKGRYVDVMAQ